MLLHSGEPDIMTTPHDRTLTGIFLMIAFCVLAPLLDASSKLATDTIPVGQITAARFVVQGACMLPLAMIMRLNWAVSPKMLAMIGLRAVSLMLSTYCFVAGVQVMPIADALAIVFVMPFILMILGKLVFGNAVGPRRIAASIVGFGGALLVIQPSLANYGLVALFPLGCACFFAVYELVTQAMADGIHPVTLQLHTSLAGCLVSVPLIWAFNGSGLVELDPVMPQGLAWVWLFGVGFWAAVSHLSMTIALQFAPASTLAPLHYLEIVQAVILGYLIWGDFPNPMTWAGIAVIASSGLYIIHRERLTAARRRADRLEVPFEAI